MPQNNDTSVFDLDTASPTPEDEQSRVMNSHKKGQKIQSKGRKEQSNKSQHDLKKAMSELKAAHRAEIQSMKTKYQTENKSLRDELKEQAKKAKEELSNSLVKAERNYQKQVDQLRAESVKQTLALREEVKTLLAGHLKGITENYDLKLVDANNAQLEKLEKRIQDEFVTAVQSKTSELEQTKAAGEAQQSRLVQEIDGKNQHIVFLEEKIKAISHYLPEDEEQQLYEELGLEMPTDDEDEDEEHEEPHKGKRKGLFSRLTASF